jgi:hypothetical protein
VEAIREDDNNGSPSSINATPVGPRRPQWAGAELHFRLQRWTKLRSQIPDYMGVMQHIWHQFNHPNHLQNLRSVL